MSLADLQRTIAEAAVLAGGEHPCALLGHKWKSIGGRACPFGPRGDNDGCGHSQAVHECEACGLVDYGQHAGEPGFDYCAEQDFDCGRRA